MENTSLLYLCMFVIYPLSLFAVPAVQWVLVRCF